MTRCTQDVMNLGRGLEILHDSLIQGIDSPRVAISACDQMLRWVDSTELSCVVKLPATKSTVEGIRRSVESRELADAFRLEKQFKQVLFDEIKLVRCGHPLAEVPSL